MSLPDDVLASAKEMHVITVTVAFREASIQKQIRVVRTGEQMFNQHTIALVGEVAKKAASEINRTIS